MAKPELKTRAILLRKNGHGIKEIARMLKVSPSTASFWCRDMQLSPQQQAGLSKRSERQSTSSLLAYAELIRARRMVNVENERKCGARLVSSLTARDITMVGIGLYWGEGYKRGSEEFGFTNSDPDMIRFYLAWLAVLFDVKKEDLIFRVSINQVYRSRERTILSFWSKLLKVPVTQFTKTSFIRAQSKSLANRPTEYHGTLRVKVRRGTAYRRQILGAIDSLRTGH